MMSYIVKTMAILICLSPPALSVEPESDLEWSLVSPKKMLETIASSAPNERLRLPADATANQVEAALNQLNAQLKPKRNRPSELETNPSFEAQLNSEERQGLDKVKRSYASKVSDGKIRPVQLPNGSWRLDPGEGGLENRGRGHSWGDLWEGAPEIDLEDWHRVGDGWWRWSLSYNWWGVRLSLNHNFLYYLCAYSTWMLDNSGLPGWIKTILRVIACAPHSLDYSSDGATVYITYLGAFWYSP